MKKLLLFLLLAPSLCWGGAIVNPGGTGDTCWWKGPIIGSDQQGTAVCIVKDNNPTLGLQIFCLLADTAGATNEFILFSFSTNDSLSMVAKINSGTQHQTKAIFSRTAGAEYLIACASNGTKYSFFGGILGSSVNILDTIQRAGTNNGEWIGDAVLADVFAFGGRPNSGGVAAVLNGDVFHQFRLYNRVLTVQELTDISITKGVGGPLIGLKGKWQFMGPIGSTVGQGTVLLDESGNGYNMTVKSGFKDTNAKYPKWTIGLPLGMPGQEQ